MKEVTRKHFDDMVQGWHWEIMWELSETLFEVRGVISNKRFMVRIIN